MVAFAAVFFFAGSLTLTLRPRLAGAVLALLVDATATLAVVAVEAVSVDAGDFALRLPVAFFTGVKDSTATASAVAFVASFVDEAAVDLRLPVVLVFVDTASAGASAEAEAATAAEATAAGGADLLRFVTTAAPLARVVERPRVFVGVGGATSFCGVLRSRVERRGALSSIIASSTTAVVVVVRVFVVVAARLASAMFVFPRCGIDGRNGNRHSCKHTRTP